jgi:hypothetical protein
MGQTITNSYGDLEVLQAYKNNVKDIFKTAYNAQNNLGASSAVLSKRYGFASKLNVGTAYGFSLIQFFCSYSLKWLRCCQ